MLPLVLLNPLPGLSRILTQEGVPFEVVDGRDPVDLARGRFVLFDGRRGVPQVLESRAPTENTIIDVDAIRGGGPPDPFAVLIDVRARRMSFEVEGIDLAERVARVPKAAIRRLLIRRIRGECERAGAIWARLSPFPASYRSAFNFRADLDEPCLEDYRRFAAARRPIDDCSTHFISTAAYEIFPEVLADLRGLDAQSHGHHHYIYRDPASNRRNLAKARDLLERAGIDPVGFAAPEGRWNPGLDGVLEESGYEYASDFALGYDDWPFFPIVDGRESKVLQVPIHPICEGLFLDAGIADPARIGAYFAGVIRAKAHAGEPAFVYGHPERRLGRMPAVVEAIARAAGELDRTWRVTLTEFSRWWRWRAARRWSLVPIGGGRFEARFRPHDRRYPLAIEIARGETFATIPVVEDRVLIDPAELRFEKRPAPPELPTPRPTPRPRGWRHWARVALDWETITPLADLRANTPTAWVKKRLRALREAGAR